MAGCVACTSVLQRFSVQYLFGLRKLPAVLIKVQSRTELVDFDVERVLSS